GGAGGGGRVRSLAGEGVGGVSCVTDEREPLAHVPSCVLPDWVVHVRSAASLDIEVGTPARIALSEPAAQLGLCGGLPACGFLDGHDSDHAAAARWGGG